MTNSTRCRHDDPAGASEEKDCTPWVVVEVNDVGTIARAAPPTVIATSIDVVTTAKLKSGKGGVVDKRLVQKNPPGGLGPEGDRLPRFLLTATVWMRPALTLVGKDPATRPEISESESCLS